jgi:hypothetical protein
MSELRPNPHNPPKDDQTPQVIEPEIEKGEPIPGFYRAVFVESWRLSIDRENVTTFAIVPDP